MAKARADINLTLGIDPTYSARRIANEMTQGFKQAGNQAGVDYNKSFTAEVDKLEPRVSRAMRKVAAALLQVDEASAKVSQRFQESVKDQDALTAATEKYQRVVNDAAATDQERADALDELTAAQDRHNQSTRALITERAKYNRANTATATSLALVNKSLEDIGKERSAGQTLLTAGKFISALRAVAIPAVGAVAAIGAANVISGAAALTHALWMIPAAGGAAAAAIGSVKIATLGFSDAIENMGDPAKFYEALQGLSPNAQQAALSIQALMDPLRQLKTATQDAFFADAGPMINQLAQQYLPMIEQLTTGIGGAFNSAFRSVFDQLLTPETQDVLQSTVNNLVLAFEKLAPAAGPFADALTRIVETGSSYLPGIAEAITDASKGFADFITKAQNSGELDKWFQMGIDAASAFWDMLKVLGRAFVELAPIGVRAIKDITVILEGLSPVVITFIQNLTNVLAPIAEIGRALKRLKDMVPKLPTWLGGKAAPPSVDAPSPDLGWMDRLSSIFGQPKIGPAPAGFYRTRDGDTKPIPRNQQSGSALADSVLGIPSGGYPMPAPPPDKGSGSGSGKADEPPFTADPSLYSLDSVPIGSFPGDAAASSAPPLAAEAPIVASPDAVAAASLPPVNMAAIPQLLGTNPAISAVAMIAEQMGLKFISGIAGPNSPTKRPFDGGFHDSGQAGDFSDGSSPTPGMRNMALWLASNFGGLIEELIYNDDMGGVGISGGVPVDAAAAFGATAHRNHIHLAVRDELVPQFLQAMQENLLGGFAGNAGYFSVDQDAITNAENDRLSAKESLEEARLRVLELEAKGDATQAQLLAARNNVAQANRRYLETENKLTEARQGSYKKFDSQFTKQAKDTTDSLSSAASGLSDIGASLANDFGISEGLPGIAKWLTTFLANLAFAPMVGALSAVSAVGNANSGTTGASGLIGMMAPPSGPMDASAMGPNPLGGGLGSPLPGQAQNLPLMKFDEGGMLPPGGMGINLTNKPEPVLTPDQWTQVQDAMQSATPVQHGTTGAAPGPMPEAASTSRAPSTVGGGGFTGLGGMPMQAINTAVSAAGLGLDAFAPGAGQAASAAAQIGIQLANRAAGYAGQVAGIAVGGLMETFLPNNSEVADPAKSWIGKIASGVSGARPAVPNQTQSSAPAKPPAMPPQQASATGGGGPVVLIENMVNQTPDGGQAVANQMARQAQTGYLSRMGAR